MSGEKSNWPTQLDIDDDIVPEKDIIGLYPRRVIVAGSRGYDDYENFSAILDQYLTEIEEPYILISGAASTGADALVIKYASEKGKLCWKFAADWDTYGKSAGYIRNNNMLERATHVVAFWDSKSRGTKNMIDIAHKAEIPVRIFDITSSDPVSLYTVCLDNWQSAKKLGAIVADVGNRGKLKAFMPSISLIDKFETGRIDRLTFEHTYVDQLKLNQTDPATSQYWEKLKTYKSIAFGTSKHSTEYCYRHILIKVVRHYLNTFGINAVDKGEIYSGYCLDSKETELVYCIQHTRLKASYYLSVMDHALIRARSIRSNPLVDNLLNRTDPFNDKLFFNIGHRDRSVLDNDILLQADLANSGFEIVERLVTPVVRESKDIVVFLDGG